MSVHGAIKGQLQNENIVNGSITPAAEINGAAEGGVILGGRVHNTGGISSVLNNGSRLSGVIRRPARASAEWVRDLGDFNIEEYGWDFWEYLADKVEPSFYKIHDTVDEFDYWFIIEAAGDVIYQEWWYSEEGSMWRNARSGRLVDGEYEWDDPDEWITVSQAYNNFALKNHTHYIEETVNQNNILSYLNGWGINKAAGSYKITNTRDSSTHYVEYDYRIAGNQYRLYQTLISSNNSNYYIRFGTKPRTSGSVSWAGWRIYQTDQDIENMLADNYYNCDEIDEMFSQFAPNNMILTTWANLVSLRDNGQLTAGAYYRITDYNFVTSKLGIQSGNHQFDVVVLAISESMVSETAYAVRHAGDHYFEREVTEGGIEWLYTIYVDDYAENYGDEPIDHADDIHSGDVFCYADTDIHPDTGEEVPVLFKTDANEYDFDDPDFDDMFYWCGTYDLDGDEYDMWGKYEDGIFMQQYALTPIVVEDGELIVSPIPETKTVPVNLNAWELKYCLDNDKDLFAWADTNGKGVIYYMKDEFGNEAPYDFKNVKYARRYVSAVDNSILNNIVGKYVGEDNYYAITTTSDVRYFYTFDDGSGNDASLFGSASYNVIDAWIVDGQKQLNDIVTHNALNSHFGSNTYSITVANSCQNVDMQGDNNLFLDANSVTGFYRQCTMVGVSSIEAVGLRTTIANGSNGIKVKGSCYNLNLGNNLTNSEFAGGCQGITFGNYCSLIKIGDSCNTITFGQYCISVNIGAYCHTITFTNYWRYVDIMDNCSRINLSTTGGNTSNYVQYITVRKAVTNVTLTPTRKLAYETIYYKTGKTETAV